MMSSRSVKEDWFSEKVRGEAVRLKVTGNGHYKKGAYFKALDCYTKVGISCRVCCEEENLALAGNFAGSTQHPRPGKLPD